MATTQKQLTPAEAQELEATAGHFVSVAFGDDKWEMVPPGAWRQSWNRLLKAGEMDAFMEVVLSAASYALYLEADPTNDEIGELINRAADMTGESLGKSSGPQGSSSGTRKR